MCTNKASRNTQTLYPRGGLAGAMLALASCTSTCSSGDSIRDARRRPSLLPTTDTFDATSDGAADPPPAPPEPIPCKKLRTFTAYRLGAHEMTKGMLKCAFSAASTKREMQQAERRSGKSCIVPPGSYQRLLLNMAAPACYSTACGVLK